MRHPEHLLAQPAWSRSESPQSRQASNPGPSADGSFSDVVLLTLSRGSGNLLGPAHPVPDDGRLACLDKTVPLLRFTAPTAMAFSTVFSGGGRRRRQLRADLSQETVACRRSNTRSSDPVGQRSR